MTKSCLWVLLKKRKWKSPTLHVDRPDPPNAVSKGSGFGFIQSRNSSILFVSGMAYKSSCGFSFEKLIGVEAWSKCLLACSLCHVNGQVSLPVSPDAEISA